MSGGSMNYLYSRIERECVFSTNTPERKAFAAHMRKIITALKAIEWVDSSDCSPGSEDEAIRACLAPGDTLRAAIDAAHDAKVALGQEIDRARQSLKTL